MGWDFLLLDDGDSLTHAHRMHYLMESHKINNMSMAVSRTQRQAQASDMGRLMLAVLLYGNILVTAMGNSMVLVVIRRERALHTAFNYLVVNLALTDLSLALTAMPLAAYEIITGYWPLGYSMCTTWILINTILTSVSVYTIVAISLERLWSVNWSLSYRTTNKMRKTSIMVTCIWVSSLVLWVPCTVVDRLMSELPAHLCRYNSSGKLTFFLLATVLCHHLPCVCLVLLYLMVYRAFRRRALLVSMKFKYERSGRRPSFSVAPSDAGTDSVLLPATTIRRPPVETRVVSEPTEVSSSEVDDINYQQPVEPNAELRVDSRQVRRVSIQTRPLDRAHSNKTLHMSQSVSAQSTIQSYASQSNSVYSGRTPTKSQLNLGRTYRSQSVLYGRPLNPKPHLDRRKYRREMRVFSAITLIMAGYLVCWLPYHIVFDLNALQPGLVSEAWAVVTSWLPYVNSTINPFLYNFSNPVFRRAFKNTFSRKKRASRS